MNKFLSICFYLTLFTFFTSCKGQKNKIANIAPTEKNALVGDGCDGCELMYNGIPAQILPVDTSAGWYENGQQLLVTGKVFKLDGKTPAPNIIIYYWQTDNNGNYSPTKNLDEKVKRHGHIRGWVKTDENGSYAIYTIKPAAYPNDNLPAHIHIALKEPNLKNEYYIDEFTFDDDKNLTTQKRKALENRGGSGILRVLIMGNLQIAEHNIILGRNIPNYPDTLIAPLRRGSMSAVAAFPLWRVEVAKISGLEIGEDNPSFIPYHAFGADKGTRTCPVCKYGRYHGIIYYVGNNPNWDEIKSWLIFLEQESNDRTNYLKVYFVYGNEKNYNKESRKKELEKMGAKLNLKNIALTFVPSMNDQESEVYLNKINPNVENTFIIYRHRTIIDKFIDLKPTAENFKTIATTLNKTKSQYFNLQEPNHE